MKILPLAQAIQKDVASTGSRFKQASADGYLIASRTAKIYKQNSFTKYVNVTREVGEKVIKTHSIKDIPYVACTIGLFVPIPFTSVIFMGLGFVIRALISESRKSDKDIDTLI